MAGAATPAARPPNTWRLVVVFIGFLPSSTLRRLIVFCSSLKHYIADSHKISADQYNVML